MNFVMALSMILAQAAAGDASEAFSRMRHLEGSWKGTLQWTGASSARGELSATYHLSGAGSALIEELIMDGKPTMTSVYHLDHGDLLMTHYCAAQNQPRLKASDIDLKRNLVRFDMVDITNLAAPDAPHVHGVVLRLVDADHVELEFATTQGKGKESVEHIALTRVG
jgi:hypothetical protein